MPPEPNRADAPETVSHFSAYARARTARIRPFAGLIDPVIVQPPVEVAFEGSVSREHALAVWVWCARDLMSDEIAFASVEDGSLQPGALAPLVPMLIDRGRAALAAGSADGLARKRLRAQIGGDAALERAPLILNALRNHELLAKAQAFGRAANAIPDDAALANALQSMPLRDAGTAALLMHAAMGQMANPTRIATVVFRISGAATEAAIRRAGFGPLVEAMLAHAQNQIHLVETVGAFADIDLACRAIERFHRLVKAIAGYVELERGGRWSKLLAALTKAVSERIEPRLREVVPDINFGLRRAREGNDRLDSDRLLAAINGVYLLATLRECKDSLALNALFEQAWAQSGQALDLHLTRNLELVRDNPEDEIIAARLEAGIKMAEIRFNPEFAETLRRARATALKR